jgi:hypothetical protein
LPDIIGFKEFSEFDPRVIITYSRISASDNHLFWADPRVIITYFGPTRE